MPTFRVELLCMCHRRKQWREVQTLLGDVSGQRELIGILWVLLTLQQSGKPIRDGFWERVLVTCLLQWMRASGNTLSHHTSNSLARYILLGDYFSLYQPKDHLESVLLPLSPRRFFTILSCFPMCDLLVGPLSSEISSNERMLNTTCINDFPAAVTKCHDPTQRKEERVYFDFLFQRARVLHDREWEGMAPWSESLQLHFHLHMRSQE